MSIKNGDLPAMPVIEESKSEQYNGATHTTATVISFGLTKREQFAMAAMQGLLSGVHGDSSLYDAAPEWVRNISEASVEFADALLAELEKSK